MCLRARFVLALLLLGASLALYGQSVLRQYTVANLPTASLNKGVIVIASDGITSSDCTQGKGSTPAWCISNGTSWVPIVFAAGSSPSSNTPQWMKAHIAFTDLAVNQGNTAVVNLTSIGPRQKVCGISMFSVTPFSGPSITGLTITVGDASSTATVYAPVPFDLTTVGQHDYNVLGSTSLSNSVVQAHFTVTGSTLNTLSSGAADIDLCLVTVP